MMKIIRAALILGLAAHWAHSGELARRCLQGDCVRLILERGVVFAQRTGEFSGKREVGPYEARGNSLVPKSEAPIRYAKTPHGWTVVVTAFLPQEFDFNAPNLRLYLFDPRGRRVVVDENYNLLGSFAAGRILHTDGEFAQISSTGDHADMVRTSVWLLPVTGPPKHVLDVHGLLGSIQEPNAGAPPGLWIYLQTYDGMHPETKGEKRAFWVWKPAEQMFQVEAR